MISTLMLVALGFLAASLVSMLIVPSIWRHAVKATAKRLQFAAPDSVVEVRADRDQLRAEHALAIRKLEVRIGELKEKLSNDAVELSRASTAIEQLEADIMERDARLGEQAGATEKLRASMSPMETELAARTGTVQQLRETVRQLEDRLLQQDQVIRQTAEAAGLEETEVEELRKSARSGGTSATVLPMELEARHEEVVSRLAELQVFSKAIEDEFKGFSQRRKSVIKLKDKLSSSTAISAREATDYQDRIAQLDLDRSTLESGIKDAVKESGALKRDVKKLDTAWQEEINPYLDLREKLDGAASGVDQVTKELKIEGDLRSLLAAIPGGRHGEAPGADPKPPEARPIRLPDTDTTVPIATAESKLPKAEPEAARAIAAQAANPKPAAQRVMSLAERIRALQEEMT